MFDLYILWGNPYVIVTNMLDWNILVCKFELQSHYYIHFETNTFHKDMNFLILPVMG